MYQCCNRRLLPSMATSTLLSPSATSSKTSCLHCGYKAIHRHSALGLHHSKFSALRSSREKGGICFKVGFSVSSWDCIQHSCTLATSRCCLCCRDCATRASLCCVRVCANSASMAASLFTPDQGYFRMRTLSEVAGSSSSGSRSNQTRALSTSVALSSKKKNKEKSAESPAIYQPSLTWGIVPHPAEGKQKVIEFLEKEGIDTTELHDVELPNTIEVMQERLDFLKKLGLTLEAINSYPLMVTCSIKKNIIPVLDYLELLGLRSRDLPKFIEKYPMVLHSSVIIDLMPVVDYLLGLDIQRKDIIKVLARYPDVMGFRLEGTMSTSVAYIVSLGVRMRCIGRMLTEYPEILGMRVANTIKPKVDFLLSHGIPIPVVATLLEKRPYVLGFDLYDTMQPVVNDLLEAGVSKEGIASVITQYPDILGQGIRENLIRKTNWLVEQVKVDPKNVPVIIEKLPQILFIKEGLAMERVRYFMNVGCSADDVARMVTAFPQLLALSIGQVIEPSLKFLLHDMKRSVKEVVKFPAYFTYDLKSRIMPRYGMIAAKGVDCSLEWFLNCTDQRFKFRLSADYLDDDELRPVFRMGGVVHTETKLVEEDTSLEEDFDSEIDQQGGKREQPRLSPQQGGKREQPKLSPTRGRYAKLHQQQRYNELETASDSDIEVFSDDEDELDIFKSRCALGEADGEYSEDDDTDDAREILRARLQDDKDLEMLDSASEFDVSDKEEERDEDDDDDEELDMSETASEREEDTDVDGWDEEAEVEEEQCRASNKRTR